MKFVPVCTLHGYEKHIALSDSSQDGKTLCGRRIYWQLGERMAANKRTCLNCVKSRARIEREKRT